MNVTTPGGTQVQNQDPRVRELVRFMQDVALGRRTATAREVNRACAQLDRYLPDWVPEET